MDRFIVRGQKYKNIPEATLHWMAISKASLGVIVMLVFQIWEFLTNLGKWNRLLYLINSQLFYGPLCSTRSKIQRITYLKQHSIEWQFQRLHLGHSNVGISNVPTLFCLIFQHYPHLRWQFCKMIFWQGFVSFVVSLQTDSWYLK